MRLLTKCFVVCIGLLCGATSYGQQLTNMRQHFIPVKTDTVKLDSLSIINDSFFIIDNGQTVDTTAYQLNIGESKLIWKKNSAAYLKIKADSVTATYRVFPLLFTQKYFNKDLQKIQDPYSESVNPFIYSPDDNESDFFKMESLNHSGSISRGISFGNNQDVVVNSSLNLQLAGRINKTWEIEAAITDNNIPLQPDGNTQVLQDFDKVYIQLSNQKTKILAGDFELTRPNSNYLTFYKRLQGGLVSSTFNLNPNKKSEMKVTGSAAISGGKFARNTIIGIEANQGAYLLTGADNENFIVVISGTEKVFIDGVPMVRGQQYDYIIDYNTAEITFTSRRIITKDSRIIVEFQYSNKSYVRSLIYFNDEYSNKNLNLRFNLYSEQDSKNQPLLQDLTPVNKETLAQVGDSLQYAFEVNAETVTFNNNEVLYKKIDSLVNGVLYAGVFVYSTASDSAFFRAGFSFLGLNKGDYVQVLSPVNGKVYQWIAPVNGIKQGSYGPVRLLTAPQKRQLLTLGGDYKINKNNKASFEVALSNQDLNLFSDKDKVDNAGYAVNAKIFSTKSLSTAMPDSGWQLNTVVGLEYVSQTFRAIEPFRAVEFVRYWNLAGITSSVQSMATVNVGVSKPLKHRINYQFETLLSDTAYKGYRNILSGADNYKNLKATYSSSFLYSDATLSGSKFTTAFVDVSYNLTRLTTGVKYAIENNRIKNTLVDTLSSASFYYQQYDVYATNLETLSPLKFTLSAGQRYDYGIAGNGFIQASEAQNASADFIYENKKNARITLGSIYRKLRVTDTVAVTAPDANTLLNRVGYTDQFLNGGITFNIIYEAGTGQELRKEFSYVEVQPGQGVYAWTDFNDNGIKELNEFTLSAFADQANYIRITLPTNTYIKTFINQLNTVVGINPAAFFKQDKNYKKIISKFSDQFAVQTNNKTQQTNLLKATNPIVLDINDTALINSNSLIRNMIFFNRTSSVSGGDYTYQNVRNKTLLTNGYEIRSGESHLLNARWNITKAIGVNSIFETGFKRSVSEYFGNLNYTINYFRVEPNFSLQPNNLFRTILTYSYSSKINELGEPREQAIQDKFSIELKYSSLKKGIMSLRFNYIKINYNAPTNSPLAYEMLEGLQNGNNLTWNFNLQRNLSKILQISVNYEGRKSKGVPTVNTAGMQARAFF